MRGLRQGVGPELAEELAGKGALAEAVLMEGETVLDSHVTPWDGSRKEFVELDLPQRATVACNVRTVPHLALFALPGGRRVVTSHFSSADMAQGGADSELRR